MSLKRITYADLHQEFVECTEMRTAIDRCIANSSFINGPEVQQFEQQWAEYTNSEACAGVSSGTSALMLALLAVGVKPGDHVIVPSMSFISTAEVVSQIGAVPVFADIDSYHLMDLFHVESLITDQVRAIIFVDLYGQTIDIECLQAIAPGIPIIQDAAQSAGCRYLDRPIGSLADATCFSFYPGKNLSAIGDAGAVTGRKDIIDRVKLLKDHGRREKYVHEVVGWNARMDGIHAAVLTAKLPYLDAWNQRRANNAEVYYRELHEVSTVWLPRINPVSSHVYNQFVIMLEQREALREFLLSRDIETGVQFPLAMHQQPVYKSDLTLPGAEFLSAHCLSLPIHPHVTEQDVVRVCDAIKEFFRTNSQSNL
jgi:dTDP-4-amino-4,6-dideoxygalactose transaminase